MRNLIAALLITLTLLTSLAVPALVYAQANNVCDPNATNLLDIDKICNPNDKFYFSLGHDKDTFPGLIAYVIQQLLVIVGILSILFIIIGGFKYITSAGNEELAESGKKTLTNAIIGLVIVILSYVIVVVVINALQGSV